MPRLADTPPKNRRQYTTIAILSLAVIFLAAILSRSASDIFRPYFGDADPLLVVVVASVLGIFSLAFLYSRHGVSIWWLTNS